MKLDGLQLLDRFDYRLKDDKLPIPEMKSWIDYDKDSFCYVNDAKSMLNEFQKWTEELPILILDETYTPNHLKQLENELVPVLPILNEEYCEDIIDKLIAKYHLQPSNYIVDLLYESLIQELS